MCDMTNLQVWHELIGYLPYSGDLGAEIEQLQHTATHCNTLQHTATHCNTLQHTATHCNTSKSSGELPYSGGHGRPRNRRHLAYVRFFQGVAVCCSVLQCVAVCCRVLQCVAALQSKTFGVCQICDTSHLYVWHDSLATYHILVVRKGAKIEEHSAHVRCIE